jgi:hypothetical protein
LYFLTVGSEEEKRYKELQEITSKIIFRKGSDSEKEDLLKSWALDCQVLCCFVAGSASDASELLTTILELISITLRHMHGVSHLSGSVNAQQARGAALSATSGVSKSASKSASTAKHELPGALFFSHCCCSLGILIGLCSPGVIMDNLEKLCGVLQKALGATVISADARSFTAENVAILLEKVGFDIPELDSLLSSLDEAIEAQGSVKSRAQKDRKSQRQTYRQVIQFVSDQVSPPAMKLKFQSQIILVSSWSGIRQLDLFRQGLGEGLHVHFLRNPLIRDIFQIPEPNKKQARQVSGEVAKARAIQRSKRRVERASSLHHFD